LIQLHTASISFKGVCEPVGINMLVTDTAYYG